MISSQYQGQCRAAQFQLFALDPSPGGPPLQAVPGIRGGDDLGQAVQTSHFLKIASVWLVAHLTASSGVIWPVAAFVIMSQMMKSL
jgi:hypothetical protein